MGKTGKTPGQAKPNSLTKTQAEPSRDERRSEKTGVLYIGLLKRPGIQDKNTSDMRCFSFLLHGPRAVNPLCMP